MLPIPARVFHGDVSKQARPMSMNNWHDPMIDEFQRSGGSHPQFGRALVLIHGIGATSGLPRPHLYVAWPFAMVGW